MSEGLVIDLDARTTFSPGEAVGVAIAWELPSPPETLTLELVWHTSGRGRTDRRAAHRVVREGGLAAAGAEVIPWVMPAGPWTHEGKLLSIGWAFRLWAGREDGVEVSITLKPPVAER